MMLVAEGAERFAHEQGIKLCANEELVTDAEREAWSNCKMDKHAAAFHRGHEQGTVGAVAIDRNGQIFAATSTGGTCCKLPGRVGDSPLIGCGCYADQETGGVSCTGYGEAIMKIVMAKTAIDFLRHSREGNTTPSVVSSQPQLATEPAMAAARAVSRHPCAPHPCYRRPYPARSRRKSRLGFQYSAHVVWLCSKRWHHRYQLFRIVHSAPFSTFMDWPLWTAVAEPFHVFLTIHSYTRSICHP